MSGPYDTGCCGADNWTVSEFTAQDAVWRRPTGAPGLARVARSGLSRSGSPTALGAFTSWSTLGATLMEGCWSSGAESAQATLFRTGAEALAVARTFELNGSAKEYAVVRLPPSH